MTPIRLLPLELVERIIDDVAEYDDIQNYKFSSIHACALVCHGFLPLCRKYIFASVILNSAQRDSPTSYDLNHLLSNSPHLAVYIRKLDYNVDEEEFVAERCSWLLPMFKKLVKLQKLSINYWRSGKLDWMLSSSARKVLLTLLHLPTLTSISLSSIRSFSLADLASCVNLKKLRIQSLECLPPNGVGIFFEALPPTPVMLERLTIDKGNVNPIQLLCHARRPDGKPIIDFSSLKKIKSNDVQLCSMTELFGMCRNLEKIILDCKSFPSSYLFIHLTLTLIVDEASFDTLGSTSCMKGLFTMLKPSLSTLVDIYIEYSIDDGHTLYNDPLGGLCHELEKMVGQNVIETIMLVISAYPGTDCTRWGELDDVLMGSPEGWPALRKVSLSLIAVRTYADTSDELFKELRGLSMTKLMESKRVQFDFQVF